MANTVQVKNISSQTSEKDVRDFFSFCGKISSISVTPSSNDTESAKSATVTFEKETAAKTALLLDNTQLGPTQVSVSSAASLDDLGASKDTENDDIAAEDKPRSRILAEYLAHGYVVSDQAIQRAIDMDKQHGVSTRFTKALTDFDSRFKVSEKVQQADQKTGISSKAQGAWNGMWSYFEKASETPTGQRIRAFYDQGNKQVLDVHNEARHLADLKRGLSTVPGTEKTTCNCGGSTQNCPCSEGKCACSGCAKSGQDSSSNGKPAGTEVVPGTDKTVCGCGGSTDSCPCEDGHCACNTCPKNASGSKTTTIPGTDNTVCSCGGDTGNCPCGEGKCACKSCAKNKSGMEAVPGTDKTKCNCGGSTESCPCAPGTCGCNNCAKN